MSTEPQTIEGEVQEIIEQLPAVRASQAIIARDEITVDEVVAQKKKIGQVMQRVMTSGVHYGVIPGTSEPALLKPGAEAILVALRLAPHYVSEKIWHEGEEGHLTVSVVCTLKHIPTGLEIATGEGLCTTRESRYAYRQGERVCPACGQPAIIKGKAEYGGGWVCFKKKGGCGSKFEDADAAILSQQVGKVPNPELADTYNTVLKMADKRALIAAVLNGTAASDVFTQDLEDAATATGEPSASTEPQPRRQEGPEPTRVPKTWAEIEYDVRLADNTDEAWALFQAFARACSYHLFGVADTKQLKKNQQPTLRQKAAGAVVWMHENIEPQGPDALFFDAAAQQQAWAAVLEGALLEIPDYVAPEPAEPQSNEEEVLAALAEEFPAQ